MCIASSKDLVQGDEVLDILAHGASYQKLHGLPSGHRLLPNVAHYAWTTKPHETLAAGTPQACMRARARWKRTSNMSAIMSQTETQFKLTISRFVAKYSIEKRWNAYGSTNIWTNTKGRTAGRLEAGLREVHKNMIQQMIQCNIIIITAAFVGSV